MTDVVRDECAPEGDGVRCDEHVELPDGSLAFAEDAADAAELGSGRFVEWNDLDRGDECINQPV